MCYTREEPFVGWHQKRVYRIRGNEWSDIIGSKSLSKSGRPHNERNDPEATHENRNLKEMVRVEPERVVGGGGYGKVSFRL